MKILEMDISARSRSCLLRAGFVDSNELVELSYEDLLEIKNLNQKCAIEILKAIKNDNKGEIFSNAEGNNLYDDSSDDISKEMDLFRKQLLKMLDSLSERERKIICLRFGLEDGKTNSLEEIAKHFGFGRDRICQIESLALRKLRHPTRYCMISGFITDPNLDITEILSRYVNNSLEVGSQMKEEMNITSGKKKTVVNKNKDNLANQDGGKSDTNGVEFDDIDKPEKDSDIMGDINVLESVIEDLDLSQRSYRCLKRAGVDIVRDLCLRTTVELHRLPNLGRKGCVEFLEKMRELGVSAYDGVEMPFMYGYPERIKRIEKERRDYWNIRLYIEIIINKYEWSANFRAKEVNLWKNAVTPINDRSEIWKLIQRKIDTFLKIFDEFTDIVDKSYETQDACKIVLTAETIMTIYRKYIRWIHSFEEISVITLYHEIVEELLNIGKKILEGFDRFYEKAILCREKIRELMDTNTRIQDTDLDLEFPLDFSPDNFYKAIDRLEESLNLVGLNLKEETVVNDEVEDDSYNLYEKQQHLTRQVERWIDPEFMGRVIIKDFSYPKPQKWETKPSKEEGFFYYPYNNREAMIWIHVTKLSGKISVDPFSYGSFISGLAKSGDVVSTKDIYIRFIKWKKITHHINIDDKVFELDSYIYPYNGYLYCISFGENDALTLKMKEFEERFLDLIVFFPR